MTTNMAPLIENLTILMAFCDGDKAMVVME